ncbi:MAG: hypothetical protein IT285_02380 [Bdellovibrionales bacterium]|nr:hypothetical protein [Bdellovibrionales bacterium]
MLQPARRDHSGIHFLRLPGAPAERARAHGMLLREEIRSGALNLLARKNQWMIRRGPGLVQLSPVQGSAVWIYERLLLPWLSRQTPQEQREVIQAIADECGLPMQVFQASLLQADGLMLLSRLSVMKHLLRHLPAGGLPGCTSAVLTGPWTKGGRTYHARNFDYPVVGHWERHPTVMFCEPTEPGEIPHVSVTTAGVHTAGITSMNREGLTVCAHAHFGRGVSFNGLPVFTIGERIIKEARTLGEAVDIARKCRRTANWALVVSSAREKDGAVIEMTPDKTEVHSSRDGAVVHSNYFHTPELHATEALLSGGVCDDLYGRICRMRQVIGPAQGKVEPATLALALGDHVDHRSGVERVFGNVISVVTTVASVVFSPEEQKFWLAARNESPVSLGDFVEVDVQRFWDRPADEELSRLPGSGRTLNPRLLKALGHYRKAYQHWHIENDDPSYAEKSLSEIELAVAAYPEDGNLWIQAGLVAFRLRKIDEARARFEAAGTRVLTPEVSRVRDLFLARCKDIVGERHAALDLYRRHAGTADDPKIRAAFRKGVRRAYRRSQISELVLDLQFPDVMVY